MNNLNHHIEINWNHLSGKKLFLACSGGVDSMTLLYLFHKAKMDIEVMHVNYHLRGEDSNLDQTLVENTCKRFNIPFHLKDIELQKILDEKNGNLQEIARNVRYDFFETKRTLSDNNYIALGQHLDDQVETFFMHIARKSGIMGLACMPDEHQQYIRPLLPFSKQEIIDFAKENNIVWREDYSNKTNKYTRNILRNILIPEIIKEIPNLKESVVSLVKIFQMTQLEIEEKIKPLIEQINLTKQISYEQFDQLSQEDKIELLRQLNQKPGLLNDLNKIRLGQKGKKIILDKSDKSIFESIYSENECFTFKKSDSKALPEYRIEKVNDLPVHFSKNELFLDGDQIIGNISIRKWKNGDRMKPIGLNGTKLLSDIIKDAKIASAEKENTLVLCDEKHILWCIGIRVSSYAIATSTSKNIIKITIQNNSNI